MFEPLGFTVPVTIRGKLLLQARWREEFTWDTPMSQNVFDEFTDYLNDFKLVKQISFNRFYGKFVSRELIGFADASANAYCTVVYLRYKGVDNKYKSSFVAYKSCVAPIKSLTIPQLELQATAALLVDLLERIVKLLPVNKELIFLYSDSKVVLSWLARPIEECKVFVKNRVGKVTSVFPAEHWSYVPTNVNSDDLGIRGIFTMQLTKSVLWDFGPEFFESENLFRKFVRTDDIAHEFCAKTKMLVALLLHLTYHLCRSLSNNIHRMLNCSEQSFISIDLSYFLKIIIVTIRFLPMIYQKLLL